MINVYQPTLGKEELEALEKVIEDVVNGKDPYMQERRRISDLFFKYHDRNSSQRLAEFLDL